MILCAMVEAAPVLTNIPVSTPAAKMRTMAGVMSFTPLIIWATVCSNPQPANNPPTRAPSIRLNTGDTFLIINTMDSVSPMTAANAVFIILFFIVYGVECRG